MGIDLGAWRPPVHIYGARSQTKLKAFLEGHAVFRNNELPELDELRDKSELPRITPATPVCIVGAGVAGLYCAMILDSLNEAGFVIPYKVVEAATPDNDRKIGGRVYTRKIGKSPWDYFDVGAMRFPKTPFMARTFRLAQTLKLKFISYEMKSENTFRHYNGRSVQNKSDEHPISGDPFNVEHYVAYGPLTADAVERDIRAALESPKDVRRIRREHDLPPLKPLDLFVDLVGPMPDLEGPIKDLYRYFDKYTMRTWLRKVYPSWTSGIINWCETVHYSTGSYDRALTEIVAETLAFDWPLDPTPEFDGEWYCFPGGSSTLPHAMHESLKAKDAFRFGQTVTAIKEDTDVSPPLMRLDIAGAPDEHSYSAIISTVPLPCLSLMDLSKCSIYPDNYAQWSAIRSLQYGPSIKIAMRFTGPWWHTVFGIKGGMSHTDLPLRVVVYPSYPSVDDPSPVLIASYCWTQDADRMGALMNGDGTARKELIDLVLRDLKTVHQDFDVSKFYTDSYFAWDWSRDVNAKGAFAFFGAQQFSDKMYGQICLPAAHNKLFFAGEATSSCHAWVAGALDSAWRAVCELLIAFYGRHSKEVDTFLKLWGRSEYYTEDTEKHSGRYLLEQEVRLALHHELQREGKL